MADGTLKVGTITNSSGSGNISIGSGVTVNVNRPAFAAHLADASQSISTSTDTKVNMTTEDYDTDDAYDPTNSKFTIPTGAAGKYRFTIGVRTGNIHTGRNTVMIFKNGSMIAVGENRVTAGSGTTFTSKNFSVELDCAAGDYFEPYVNMVYNAGVKGSSASRQTYWSAHKIGA